MIPESVADYARLVGRAASAAADDHLIAVYLHGSAVLGGWTPDRSDVDILVVAGDEIDVSSLRRVGLALAGTAGSCPGRKGLETSVVLAREAAAPQPPWPFLLHVTTEGGDPAVVRGADSPGDPDLLMHYAVCRAAGWAVHGPPARARIGPVPREVILAYLADEAGWGLENAPEAYAVLNACRATVFLTDGQIVSKVAGGQIALRRGLVPAALIERALAQQEGLAPETRPAPDAVEFVRATAATLRAAAAG
jgi:Domain of unknown function (DUF4111)/Nucleotidyltransferase domain